MSDAQEPQSAQEPQNVRDETTAPGESASAPDDIAPSLASLIASIRAALTRGASAETRAVGVNACRSILTVLEAKPGQPLAAAPPPVASPASPLAGLLSQPGLLSRLAGMSRDELVGLLKQVTGAMPVQPQTPATAAPRFHLIQIPVLRRPGGS